MTPDDRLSELQVKIGVVEDRVARLRLLLSHGNVQWAETAAMSTRPVPSANGVIVKPLASVVSEDRDDQLPLRHQPQPNHEFVTDLRGRDSDRMQRQRQEISRLGVRQCRWRRTPTDYYAWTLEQRRAYLGPPSVAHLCKSMVMVNKKAPSLVLGKSPDNPLFSSHYLVVYQYEAKFSNEKLIEFLRRAAPPPMPPKKHFNFRVASEADNDLLSGSPIGFSHKLEVPFVLDRRILDTVDFVWLGGGEIDVKLAMSVSEFIRIFDPIIAPVTTAELIASDVIQD